MNNDIDFTTRERLDDFIPGLMEEHLVPGLQLALMNKGEIVFERAYGLADASTKAPVRSATLFQAGSVSKPVAAAGALSLVERGVLDLDTDVNEYLRSWKVPENDNTRTARLTLRAILSHSGGLNVHGFPGYRLGTPLPTLPEILEGKKPANTPAIRADRPAGSTSQYSGGGYVVMQQMMIDATGRAFPKFLSDEILDPAGMASSTYAQPLPSHLDPLAATGHDPDNRPIQGLRHVYPEMAAAGLWTTATDLARFILEIHRCFMAGRKGILSPAMASEMLTPQKDKFGLGFVLGGEKNDLLFTHNGRNAGFDAFVFGHAHSGKGGAILINANNNSGFISGILNAIGRTPDLS